MEEKWREKMDRDRSLRGGHGRGKGGGYVDRRGRRSFHFFKCRI